MVMKREYYLLFIQNSLAIALLLPSVLLAQGAEPNPEPGSYEHYYQRLKSQYNSLVKGSTEGSAEAYEWVKRDLKNMSTWEYKRVAMTSTQDKQIDSMLLKAGKERWQLVQVVPVSDRLLFFFKRPGKSYLKSSPLKQLAPIVR